MTSCYACGRSISPSEAYARLSVAGESYVVCCPMCMSAVEVGEMQRQLIAKSFATPQISVSVEYLPALLVGGDYLSIRSPRPGRFHVLLTDISGHGVTSSLVVARMSAEIERRLDDDSSSESLVLFLNEWMRSRLGERGVFYLTLFHAVIDLDQQELTYISCGHPPQLLWSRSDRSSRTLESHTFPVGMFEASALGHFRAMTMPIELGDRLLIFTDGFMDLAAEEYGIQGIKALLEGSTNTNEVWQGIKSRVQHGRLSIAEDDILVALIETHV